MEARDFEQFTPLLLSACYTNANILKHLLKAGAQVTSTEYRDKNAFHLASEFDRTDALKVSQEFSQGYSEYVCNGVHCSTPDLR